MGERARSTIGASGVDRLVEALLVTPFAGLALGAAVFGAQAEIGAGWRAFCWSVAAAALVGGAAFARVFVRPQPRLRMNVTPDTITFRQRGRRPAAFRRADIEMVVIEQGVIAQTCALSVYGDARRHLGTWQTGWIATPTMKVIDTLEGHGYPHAFRHPVAPQPADEASEWPWFERRRSPADGTPVPSIVGRDESTEL